MLKAVLSPNPRKLPLHFWACVGLSLSLAACSGAASGGGDDAGENSGGGGNGRPSQGSNAANGNGNGNGADPDGGLSQGGDDGGGTGSVQCKLACADDDCGEFVSDDCGGHLVCTSTCGDGKICGVMRRDKCDFPAPVSCVPKTAAEVCPGKCGSVEDGCSDVVVCSSQNGGLTCGDNQYCQGAGCVDSGSCTPKSAATVCANKCGVVSNGCSDVYFCSDQNGGLSCGVGKKCDESGGQTDNTCVALPPSSCVPQEPASACNGKCGIVSDGCGDQIDCDMSGFGCPVGKTCGGGNVPGQCGSGTVCMPASAASVCAGKCGFVQDGCGGGYVCTGSNGGLTCDANAGLTCGGGGVLNQCGKPACIPKTTLQACPGSGSYKSCGKVSNGCGELIDCQGCLQGQSCGLTTPNLCGDIPSCQPIAVTTACASKCGTVADGCGGTYSCGSGNGGVVCSGGEYCGANQANKCGSPVVTCTPKTCAQLGHSCGLASDGCGHVINCWPGCAASSTTCSGSCSSGSACLSSASGAQSCVVGTPACVGSLCSSVPTTCAANSPTRLTGTVRTPGMLSGTSYINQLPIPNALIYIPAQLTSNLPDIFEGVSASNSLSCGRCADEKLVADGESVLAAAVSDYKGQFTLEGRIPVGTAFRIVVKIGKWRRVIQVPAGIAQACASKALISDYTRVPASASDGLAGTHLPKIAISTGQVDEMECVFRGIGIKDSEFTVPSGSGRVHMYRSNGAKMGKPICNGKYKSGGITYNCSQLNNTGCNNRYTGCSWGTQDVSVADTTLFATQSKINEYDLVVYDCEGAEQRHAAADGGRVESYVNAGGRMFASHYSYVWIEQNGTLDQSATWGAAGSASSGTGYISLPSGPTARTGANRVKSLLFRDWLDWQGALTGTTPNVLNNPTTPQFAISEPRDRAGANVGTSTDEWVYRNNSGAKVQQLSFNTPYGQGADKICGRVAYSGFHVANASDNSTLYFPDICTGGVLSAQEKILAFMLFDLATCVSAGDPPQPPACTPKTAAQICPGVNDACGYVADGCGGVVNCAGCGSGFYCDGNACRPQECTPSTCTSLGFNCGEHADGCGGIARNSQGVEGCGTCGSGQICGLGGPGLCGSPSCTPIPVGTACPANSCGLVSNGCGGTYSCGICPDGKVCGGGGANLCGPGSCATISKVTACAGKNCGLVSDGCGGSYECGSCAPPDSCGGGGQANVCGHPTCTPLTQAIACNALQCGWVSNGCGGAIQCGTCPNGGVCGGAGPNLCGNSCTPTSCTTEQAQCGAISDQCGGVLSCGTCTTGQSCGATAANKCGTGTTCTARTCLQAGAQCGLVGDGCGAVLDCGECTVAGQTCGGAGQANQCGVGTGGCNKLTCQAQNVQCGATSDGCGGLLDCGGCAQGYTCERSKCEQLPPILL